jgi:transcriptional regulator with XRE-family HTH domain
MKTSTWAETRARRSKLTQEQRNAIDAKVEAEVARMRLPDLRKARNLTQAAMANTLGIAQAEVSRMERRTDVYISTLRSYVEAMGGKLRIVAEFPHVEPIELDGLGDLQPQAETVRKRA